MTEHQPVRRRGTKRSAITRVHRDPVRRRAVRDADPADRHKKSPRRRAPRRASRHPDSTIFDDSEPSTAQVYFTAFALVGLFFGIVWLVSWIGGHMKGYW